MRVGVSKMQGGVGLQNPYLHPPYIRYAIYNIFYYYYICHLPYIFDVPKVAFDRINIGSE